MTTEQEWLNARNELLEDVHELNRALDRACELAIEFRRQQLAARVLAIWGAVLAATAWLAWPAPVLALCGGVVLLIAMLTGLHALQCASRYAECVRSLMDLRQVAREGLHVCNEHFRAERSV
jgi:hypothetical protein